MTDLTDEALDKLVELLEAWETIGSMCSISDGVCCCGDNMDGHSEPMDCGHTPTDHGAYYARTIYADTIAAAILALIPQEPKP